MASKLAQLKKRNSEKVDITNWRTIKSRLEKQKFYQQNKKDIQKYERLKNKADQIKQEKINNLTDLETYRTLYQSLEKDLKQFFPTPESVEEDKGKRIEDNKKQVLQEINRAEKEFKEEEKVHEIDTNNLIKNWNNKSSDYRASNYQWFKQQRKAIDDRLEEAKQYYNNYIGKLKWGEAQLNKGKDYTYNSIRTYANKYGKLKEKEERYDNKQEMLQKKYADMITEVENSQSWKEYTINYNKLPQVIKQGFISPYKSGMKESFEKTRTYEDYSKQGLKPIFQGNEIIGYEDAILGMSYDAESYEKYYKDKREKMGINYNPKTNQITWTETKQEAPTYQIQQETYEEPTNTQYGKEIDYSKYDLTKHTKEEIDRAKRAINWGTIRRSYLKDPKWYDTILGGVIQGWDWTVGLAPKFIGNIEHDIEEESGKKLPYEKTIENWQINLVKKREELRGITQRDSDITRFAETTGKEYKEIVEKGEMTVEEANMEANNKVKEYAQKREEQRIQEQKWTAGIMEKALWLPQHTPSNVSELVDDIQKGYLGYKVLGGLSSAYKYAPAWVKTLGSTAKWGIRGWNLKTLLDKDKEKGDRFLAGTFLAVDLGAETYRAFNKKQQIQDAILKSSKTAEEKKRLIKILDEVWETKKFRGEAGYLTNSLDKMGRLTDGEKKQIITALINNKENVIVGGSLSTNTQLISVNNGRTPNDIDLYTSKDTWSLTDDIAKQLENEGNIKRIKISGSIANNKEKINALKDGKSYIIVLQKTKEGKEGVILGKEGQTLFEIHDYSRFAQNIKEVNNPIVEFFSPSYTKTKEGVRVLSIDTQAKRKIVATLQRNNQKDITDLTNIINDWQTRELTGNYIPRLFSITNPITALGYGSSTLPTPKDYMPYSIPAITTSTVPNTPNVTITDYPQITTTSSIYPPEYDEPERTETPDYTTEDTPDYPPIYPPTTEKITIRTPEIIIKETGDFEIRKGGSSEAQEVEAYQTKYYTEGGQEIEGRIFPNITEATAEGFDVVDQTPLEKFNIKRVKVRASELSRHQGTNKSYKFKSKGNLYIEKTPYRKDTPKEKSNFNIFPYVFGK